MVRCWDMMKKVWTHLNSAHHCLNISVCSGNVEAVLTGFFFTFLSSHQLRVSTCFLRNDVINMSRARDKEKISDRNFRTLVECCNYWARRDPWRGGSWIEGSCVWHASCVLTTIHKDASLTFHSSLPCHRRYATGQTGLRSTKYDMRCYLGKRKKWNWTICWPQIRDD